MNQEQPRVVIVGAGFGGLWAARALADEPVDVLLVDKNNYHAFWPLLYQVAAAELEAEQIAYPVRRVLRTQENASFVMDEVREIDLDARTLHTVDGPSIGYDFLILAPGSASSFFGIPGAADYTFPLKTMEEGVALRNHILRCFEVAIQEPNPARRRQLLTFVVVGGGPTGVEYAGALAELIHGPLLRDFRGLDVDEVCVTVIEMMETLLPGMPERLGNYAARRLEEQHVDVRLETAVAEVTENAVMLEGGERIDTETVIWTAGVRGAPLAEASGLETTKGGRVPVLPTLQLTGRPEVYVAGDLAAFEGEDGELLPMLAPVANQQGEHAAYNISRQLRDQEPVSFHYFDKGAMATIGRGAAVAEIFHLAFTGFVAWIIWLVVHLFQLIGFRNRLAVMINWAWSYLFFERMVRVILPVADELDAAFEEKRVDEEDA
ncbi:MAG: NAD(P)/FAD-dependent oxidoreductase [Candidatus Promineifilaceae bacterium]|nr:NAD(P)/FAD-dependent oxidoreductase [Candidatus Promineifilaceae bacterium]